jgi:hypothetical protein
MRARQAPFSRAAPDTPPRRRPVKLLALWVAFMVLNPSLISGFSLCSSYGVPNILLNDPSAERTPILAFEFTFPMVSRLMNP